MRGAKADGPRVNVGVEDHLELRDAADAYKTAPAILLAAFEERQSQEVGEAVMLDAVVEIAAEAGYIASVDQAGSILKVGSSLSLAQADR